MSSTKQNHASYRRIVFKTVLLGAAIAIGFVVDISSVSAMPGPACSLCNGTGIFSVRCSGCDGKGVSMAGGFCLSCGGHGKIAVACPLCHGTGESNTPKCPPRRRWCWRR
jgi:hypothetical protein